MAEAVHDRTRFLMMEFQKFVKLSVLCGILSLRKQSIMQLLAADHLVTYITCTAKH